MIKSRRRVIVCYYFTLFTATFYLFYSLIYYCNEFEVRLCVRLIKFYSTNNYTNYLRIPVLIY